MSFDNNTYFNRKRSEVVGTVNGRGIEKRVNLRSTTIFSEKRHGFAFNVYSDTSREEREVVRNDHQYE